MRYLIQPQQGDPFFTGYYSDNFYADGMMVYDLQNHTFTKDGKDWFHITTDNL